MATYRILYWQDIPSVIEVKEGRRARKHQLSGRFQELIDQVAMRKQLFGTDAYLEQWRKGPQQDRDGSPEEVLRQVSEELESRFESIRAASLAKDQEA